MASLAERKRNWNELLEGTRKNCILVEVGETIDPEKPIASRPEPWPDKVGERLEYAYRQYDLMAGRFDRIDDDRIPHLDLFTGTEIFAECFGSPISRFPEEMPFALPAVRDAAEAAKLEKPRWEDTPLAYVMKMAETARARYPGVPIRLPDTQSPFDVAALIWDKQAFYPALLEDPAAVRGTADLVEALMVEFLDEWFRRFGPGYIAHYPAYYMEKGITLSVDEVGSISTEVFRSLVEGELTRLSAHYGGLGVHCCADAAHQWPLFARIPGICLLNFMPTRYTASGAFPVVGTRAAQMHQWKDQHSWKDRIAQTGKDTRIVWWWSAANEEDAVRGIGELREALAASGRDT